MRGCITGRNLGGGCGCGMVDFGHLFGHLEDIVQRDSVHDIQNTSSHVLAYDQFYFALGIDEAI